MTQVKELIQVLEKEVPIIYQEQWDNSGLIIGDSSLEINAVLLTVDVTVEVIEEAIEKGANIIIAHHPIIFKGLKTITGKTYVEKAVLKAIKNDVAIYAMHTNLDVLPKGVSFKMAEKLNLQNVQTLDISSNYLNKLVVYCPNAHVEKVRKALFKSGAGQIGNYDQCSFNLEGTGTYRASENTKPYVGSKNKLHFEPETRIETIFPNHLKDDIIKALIKAHPYEEVAYDIYTLDQKDQSIGLGKIGTLKQELSEKAFLNLLKEKFNLNHLRFSPFIGKPIKVVAVSGGSCSFLTPKVKGKADVFVTADIKYHEFFDAEQELLLVDIGHFESEQFSKDIFYEIITKNFTNFAVHFSEIITNPINYL